MKGNQRDESDEILDRALTAYSAQEPVDGLEGRVLARVLADRPAPKFGFPWWSFAVAAAAGVVVLAVAVGVYRESSARPRATHPEMQLPPVARDVGQALPPANSAAAKFGTRKRLPHVLPKLQQFPAPLPLTQQERALLAFVDQAPEEAQELATEQAQESVPPIQIEAIQIEPLDIDGLQEEQ